MSVPTIFELSSDPEIVQGNVLRIELLPSCRYKSISLSVRKLVQRSQERRVGNIPKPLEGGYELLLTHQEHSGSGKDHRPLRRSKPIFLQGKALKYKELVKEPKYFISRPEEGTGNDPRF
ncbi:hypothetical protein O181_035652 [Austropuccinia psidii MF-1]|uniref:Uncharacterized protein n=1 Tax=Austropuccinia psidii MF-1 TaxID=1389203 RepID=A0A9Q3D5L7_9BASI|nr:hypothetical protein [Austropuccinia psidii MF-1]